MKDNIVTILKNKGLILFHITKYNKKRLYLIFNNNNDKTYVTVSYE
jgi:hypothetical protein